MSTASPGNNSTWKGLWNGSPGLPHVPLDEETRQRMDLPGTLLPAPEGLNQPVVFEPALQHFSNAYRAGEPRFEDPETGRAWQRARRTVLDVVLAAIAEGPWARHLVLRGSVLMATWFPETARDPGDLDFVVVPQEWAITEPRTAELFVGIAQAAAAAAPRSDVVIDAGGAVTEDIWTYDRVPGRRMLLPWTAPGTAGGTVQLDVVFNETLPAPAMLTELSPLGAGPGCRVLAATPELSLAWKLLWLVSDAHPQGKDLYDAVLLAEHSPPSYEQIRDASVLGGHEGLRPAGRWWLENLITEDGWAHFAAEHPWVEGTAASYTARLERALAPLLHAAEPHGEDDYDRWARWLRPLVDACRASNAPHPADPLTHLVQSEMNGLTAAVIVVREVLGRRTVSVEEALGVVMSHDAFGIWRGYTDAQSRVLGELS
ncbi:nucleotidyl transferase AbiEii/AbiGii toxin family protein [Streptomyces sp. NPDC057136]|uniref:nucleotidyl transferase AbiEii/AbiGii toxin family protein n=1 Tax=Streptomyces sp. NPDC057136 TaxID=3346029 RepID=UPI00362A6F5B